MTKGPFTTEELLKLVDILVKKYRGFPYKDDLKQEALLSYYESIALGVEDSDTLVTNMRKAMIAFANYKSKPTKIPNSGNTYKFTKKISPEEYDKLNKREQALYQALHPESVDIDNCDELLVSGVSTFQKVQIKLAFEELTEKHPLSGRLGGEHTSVPAAFYGR